MDSNTNINIKRGKERFKEIVQRVIDERRKELLENLKENSETDKSRLMSIVVIKEEKGNFRKMVDQLLENQKIILNKKLQEIADKNSEQKNIKINRKMKPKKQQMEPKTNNLHKIRLINLCRACNNILQAFIVQTQDENYILDDVEFSMREIILVGIYQKLQFDFISWITNYMNIHIPMTILSLILLQFTVGIPFYFISFFLGSYAKRKILDVWECTPVFAGLAYTTSLVKIISILINHHTAATIVLILYKMNVKDSNNLYPWDKCNFKEASPICLSQNMRSCNTSVVHEISIENYYKNVLNTPNNMITNNWYPYINIKLLISNASLWIPVLLCLLYGFKRLLRFYINCIFFFLFFGIALYLSITLGTNEDKRIGEYLQGTKPLSELILDMNFWAVILSHGSDATNYGFATWLGSMASPNKNAKCSVTVFIIYVCTSCIIILFGSFSKICNINIFTLYNLDKCKIKKQHGISLIIYYIPDILSTEFPGETVLSIYYFTIILYILIGNMINITAIYDSIFFKFRPKRRTCKHIIVFSIMLFALCSVVFSTNHGLYFKHMWSYYALTIIGLIIIVFASITYNYMYTSEALQTDYLFIYQFPVSPYYTATWNIYKVVAIFTFSLTIMYVIDMDKVIAFNRKKAPIAIILSAVTILPFIITFCAIYFKAVINKTVAVACRPTEDWGPYNENQKIDRRNFFPERDICFRHKGMTCTHTCLNKIDSYAPEYQNEISKFDDAVKLYYGSNDDDGSSFEDLNPRKRRNAISFKYRKGMKLIHMKY